MNDQTSQYFPNITSAIAFLEGAGYTPTVLPKIDLAEWSMRPRNGQPVQARIVPHGGGVTVFFEIKEDDRINYGHRARQAIARSHLKVLRAVLEPKA